MDRTLRTTDLDHQSIRGLMTGRIMIVVVTYWIVFYFRTFHIRTQFKSEICWSTRVMNTKIIRCFKI